MSPAPNTPADQEDAVRERYTVVYEGDLTGVKILSGEPAVGRAVTVMIGDMWEEVRSLRTRVAAAETERGRLVAQLRESAMDHIARDLTDEGNFDRLKAAEARATAAEAKQTEDRAWYEMTVSVVEEQRDDYRAKMKAAEAQRDQLAADLRNAEERVTRLHEARQSALRQMNEQRARADAAEQKCIELERGALHPALVIDVQQHRDEAYKTGWDDGYAEGHAKASTVTPDPQDAGGTEKEHDHA